jgi:hypothetical protein
MSTVRVPLGNDKYAFIDEEDAERVSQHSWICLSSPRRPNRAYAQTTLGGKTTLLHRFVTEALDGVDVDHINRNGLDNRKCNLRPCTQTLNNGNARKRRGTIGYRGVEKRSDGWCARLQCHGVTHRSEIVATEREAAETYDRMAREYFGAFAYQNLSDALVAVPAIEDPDSLPIIPRPSVAGQRIGPSGFRGVSYRKHEGLWNARFTENGHRGSLGYFRTAEDAARAYDAKAREAFGETAWLNFPDGGAT